MGYRLEGGSMMRINENLLIGGDIGNVKPTVGNDEINERQYDSIVGQFYRVKGNYARTNGSGSFKPVKVGEMVSYGILVKGAQPHRTRAVLHNGTTDLTILEKNGIEITTDWQWIVIDGVTGNEVQVGDKVQLYVYPKDFELHWAKAGAYIGAPSDIWTPAHADMTPEQIALMKYGEFTEAKQI